MQVVFCHIDIVTSRRIMLKKPFKRNLCDSFVFSGKLFWIFYVFIVPLLWITFNVFYYVHCEGKTSCIAYFSIYVFVSRTVWWSNGTIKIFRRKIIINEQIFFRVLFFVDWIANNHLAHANKFCELNSNQLQRLNWWYTHL